MNVDVHASVYVYIRVAETFQNCLDVYSYYCIFTYTYQLTLTYTQMVVWVIGYEPAYNHTVTPE